MELRFANVSKIYRGGVRALDGVTLVITSGECVAIVGPSGGGKTTLLRLTAGLEAPTSGIVWHDAQAVGDIAPAARNVAMAFQIAALYPQLNIRENLAIPLRYHPVPTDEATRRINDIAVSLEIAGTLDRRPHELSGGQRQRVALGRCLVRQPGVLLLDEPLGQLDVPLRAAVREVIMRICRDNGTTVLWVTHDPAEASAVGDRVVELRDGRLVT